MSGHADLPSLLVHVGDDGGVEIEIVGPKDVVSFIRFVPPHHPAEESFVVRGVVLG